ncbi:hypothetical protein [Streptomyces sp. NPDC002159]
MGQVAVAEKSNEIPAARRLLELLDLQRAVVTMDALHTPKETARQITAAGDWVLTVKAIRSRCMQLKALPWARIPAVSRSVRGHGRR